MYLTENDDIDKSAWDFFLNIYLLQYCLAMKAAFRFFPKCPDHNNGRQTLQIRQHKI